MGTNYYLYKNACKCCGRGEETIHIGKSSGGWCFSLHVDESLGINDLDDWLFLFNDEKNIIKNEYGDLISFDEMLKEITNRKWNNKWDEPVIHALGNLPSTWEKFHAQNHSEAGPNGLLRHKVDPEGYYCVKHGSGTWDCIRGDFS